MKVLNMDCENTFKTGVHTAGKWALQQRSAHSLFARCRAARAQVRYTGFL